MEEPVNQKKNNGIILWVVGLIIVIGVFVGIIYAANKSGGTVATRPTDQPTSTDTTTATPTTSGSSGNGDSNTSTSTASYKDGTYTANGTYSSPAGPESVTVTLTLKDDSVTDATVVGNATNPTSKMHQSQFISGYKQYVIGKDISTLSLSKVSGSSLTPMGFNNAVAQIKTQAQA